MENCTQETARPAEPAIRLPSCCAIRFRPDAQPCMAVTLVDNLHRDEVVMVQSDHGLEPAQVYQGQHPCGPGCGSGQPAGNGAEAAAAIPTLVRRANSEELEKFKSLQAREQEAFTICQRLIDKHQLPMKLLRAERFFNGSKIIFYFTAESRVDFRELVKGLVQEFRTRVEIRQVGVRHETKMIGGIGCCGRELCCSAYIRNFSPVSIKMAKEQGLPLNPAKISGICNRLLCCLTYEFETYQQLRRRMPKAGKTVTLDGRSFKVLKLHVLEERVEVCALDEPGRTIIWQASEWQRCQPLKAGGRGGSEKREEKQRA